MKKINICVFISGRGSNLKALLDACQDPKFPARISCIISNKPQAGGLDYAKEFNIPFAIISHKDYATKQDFEEAILDALSHEPVDLICLAGFMRILSPYFIEKWGANIINIHPSLLPKYKGLDTHKRAIEAGDKEAGCTVHYVIPEMDAGDIIIQRTVKILKKDTVSTLEKKVLVEEHVAYPDAVKTIAQKILNPDTQTELNFSTTKSSSKKDIKMTNKQAVQDSQAMWKQFTDVSKYAAVCIVGILALLALFLL